MALKPHVDLLDDAEHWRGEIGPHFSDAEWALWFASYSTYMQHMAQLAVEMGNAIPLHADFLQAWMGKRV